MSAIQQGDLAPFTVIGSRDIPATVKVATGEASYGTSSSKVFFVGDSAVAVPSSGNPDWAFGSQDQIEFGRHLAVELQRNGTFSTVTFDSNSEDGYVIKIDFERTIQYQDKSKYDFYLTLSIFSDHELEYEKKYVVKSEYGLKEFLIGTTHRAGKAREANKLMALVIDDIQKWVNN